MAGVFQFSKPAGVWQLVKSGISHMHSGQGNEERLGQILEDLAEQSRRGITPDVEQQCMAHPDLAERIRELYSVLYFMEENKPVADLSEAKAPDLVRQKNSTIGGYLIVREIARGGMGIVYEAVQLSLRRRVALKVISRHLLHDQKAIERFRREARVASQLHHSSIVPVFDVGEEGDTGYYAMQFISGQSLDQVIREISCLGDSVSAEDSARLTVSGTAEIRSSSLYRNAARIAMQVAEALAYAHEQGVLHRDIKPSNILIDARGNSWVTDFGLARFDESSGNEDQTLTKTGDVVGTLKYLAPERLRGQSDHRCDIYGLAATLYELILCRPLFEAIDRVHLIDLVTNHEPDRPCSVDCRLPKDLETIILKGLSKSPSSRYQSAQSMADDLRLFLLDRPIQARRTTWMHRMVMWCRRNRAVAGLGALLSVVMTILMSIFLVNRTLTSERDEATTARNQAVKLLQRATKAEQESSARAIVNNIAAYRLTLEPELTPKLQQLKSIGFSGLSSELQFQVRSELISCMLRDDWFTTAHPLSETTKDATFDVHRQRVASLTSEGFIELSDLRTGEMLARSSKQFPFRTVRFSPRGDYIILCAENNDYTVVRTHDLSEVETAHRIAGDCFVSDAGHRMAFRHAGLVTVERTEPGVPPEQRVLLHHVPSSTVYSIDLSRDGRRLTYQTSSQVVVIDVESGKTLAERRIEGGICVAFSPDGRWLATNDGHGRLLILESESLETRSRTSSFNAVISRICWDQDSRLVAFQTWNRSTIVVNPWTQRTLIHTREPLDLLELVFEGGVFASQFVNGQLEILNWRQGLSQDCSAGPLRYLDQLIQISVHPTLPLMVGRTPSRLLWFELPSGRLLWECEGIRPLACDFSADGTQFVTVDHHLVLRWQIESEPSTRRISIRAIEPTRHQLAAEGVLANYGSTYIQPDSRTAIALTPAGSIAELNLESGELTRNLCYAPDSLVTPLGGGRLCGLSHWHQNVMSLLDTQSGNLLGQLDTGPYSRVFADPDLTTIATTNEKLVEFWTVQPLARTGKSLPHPVQQGQVTWHPKGHHLVTQTEMSALDIRSVETLQSVSRLEADPSSVLTQLQFSRDGRFLLGMAGGQGSTRIWNLATLSDRLQDWGLEWDLQLDAASTQDADALPLDSDHQSQGEYDFTAAQPSISQRSAMLIDEARALYAREPSHYAANNLAWELLMANRSSEEAVEAESLIQPIMQLVPENYIYRNTLGLALYRVGKFQEAKEHLQANHRQTTGLSDAVFDTMILALVCKRLGDDSSAASYLALSDDIRLGSLEISTDQKEELEILRSEYDTAAIHGL